MDGWGGVFIIDSMWMNGEWMVVRCLFVDGGIERVCFVKENILSGLALLVVEYRISNIERLFRGVIYLSGGRRVEGGCGCGCGGGVLVDGWMARG